MRSTLVALLLPFLALVSCRSAAAPAPGPREATSFLGDPLVRPALDPVREIAFEARLQAARTRLSADPEDPLRWIWVGRRLAYLGRYGQALEHYTRALARFPDEVRLLRHRGHRYLTIRQPGKARADLRLAAEKMVGTPDRVEPDGLPNAAGIPLSTTQTNVLYHLGLAHRILGEDELARAAFQRSLELSGNDDMRVASAYWVVLSLWRLGEDAAAERVLADFDRGLELLENHDYHLLLRAFARRDPRAIPWIADPRREAVPPGEPRPGSVAWATRGYGRAALLRHLGREEEARAVLERVVAGENWPAFGHLAAEADLAALARPSGNGR